MDRTRYQSVSAEFMVMTNDTDPSLDNMEIYYSTDHGETWCTEKLSLNKTVLGKLWGSTNNTVYLYTTENILPLLHDNITNLLIRPYGNDGTLTVGAFRLLELTLCGII